MASATGDLHQTTPRMTRREAREKLDHLMGDERRQKGREGKLSLGITGRRKKLNHLMGDRRGEEAL
jgi:hypothetical protein